MQLRTSSTLLDVFIANFFPFDVGRHNYRIEIFFFFFFLKKENERKTGWKRQINKKKTSWEGQLPASYPPLPLLARVCFIGYKLDSVRLFAICWRRCPFV
jgi:hypothetical protein